MWPVDSGTSEGICGPCIDFVKMRLLRVEDINSIRPGESNDAHSAGLLLALSKDLHCSPENTPHPQPPLKVSWLG